MWQPIETAPKDNKRPLWLARFNDDGTMQSFDYNGSWESESESWEMPQVYYYWASESGNVEEPSHWAYQPEEFCVPGAQPAPIEQDTSVRKAWARFSNELHRSPNAPYPGMSEAFEQHFSQSFTDREWRAESATWAAAWKAAKRHEAQAQPAPSVPECPYPCGWRNLLALAIEDGAYLARSINEDEPVTEHARAATMQMVVRLRDVLIAINKVAQEAKP